MNSNAFNITLNPWTWVVNYMAGPAEEAATRMGITGGQDRNAFIHAYFSAMLVYETQNMSIGAAAERAYWLGVLKEVPGLFNEKFRDYYKDMWNNSYGLDIGMYARANALSPDQVEVLVRNALRDGHLIRDDRPGRDPRIPETPEGGYFSWPTPITPRWQPPGQNDSTPPRCFLAGTSVVLADGSVAPIETLRPGNAVLAFAGGEDAHAPHAPGAPLEPRLVTRVLTNVAQEVVELRHRAPGTDTDTLVHLTPGHVVLTASGRWLEVRRALMEGESLVTAAGEAVTPAWRVIRFDSEEGRRLSVSHPAFAPVTLLVAEDEHGRALAPRPVTGWRTYNLEVEGLHTYVAGGIRVHNDYFGFVTMMSDDRFATVANMMRNPHGPRVGKLPLRTEAYIRCTKDSTLQKQLSGSQVTRSYSLH